MAVFERNDDLKLNLEATELRLGLPGCDKEPPCARGNKRALPIDDADGEPEPNNALDPKKPAKAQVVGWPPVRSYRKNQLLERKVEAESSGAYVKVGMDGAPYLRKMDLKAYKCYAELLKALEGMFFRFKAGGYSEREGYDGSEFVPTYEDKDGDWMLVGDVPWEMFMSTCKRLRIMKGSEAGGLGCAL